MHVTPHVTIPVELRKLSHVKNQQVGAMVAYLLALPGVIGVDAMSSYLSIRVEVNALCAQKFDIQRVRDELAAMQDLDPMPCPCGCGAFMALTNCFKQSGMTVDDGEKSPETSLKGLTPSESIDALAVDVRGHYLGTIHAIRDVRLRTGASLREAKEAVDRWRLMLPEDRLQWLKKFSH